MSAFVIVRDDPDRLLYFIRLGLGVFWECGHNEDEARKFVTRARAAEVMQKAGKHRQGWRVLKVAA
jgi:hypothetical protein